MSFGIKKYSRGEQVTFGELGSEEILLEFSRDLEDMNKTMNTGKDSEKENVHCYSMILFL